MKKMKRQTVENINAAKETDHDSLEKQKRLIGESKIKPIKLTPKQIEVLKIIDDNDVCILMGSAGTSKTFISCMYALNSLKTKKFEQIILTKPIQEAGEKLGALPGDIDDKIGPYYDSYYSNFTQIIDKTQLGKLYEKNIIINKPLAYMRGSNHLNALTILDEAQNCTWKQIMLFVTRMGKGSKVIIAGDISQYDIQKNMSALLGFSNMVSGIPGVAVYSFKREDIMRHPILMEITDRYEKLKYSNQIQEEK